MATSRRIFLQVLGSGAAVSLDFACGPAGGVIGGPEGLPDPIPGNGYPGPTGTGGSGAGGGTGGGSGGSDNGSGGAGGQGTGGIQSERDAGSGGSAGQGGSGGAGGGPVDSGTGRGGRPVQDAGRARDAGTATGDAAAPPVLGPGDISAGNISSLTVGSLNRISGQTVAIGRDAMGVYAMTMICTHQGCTINAPSGGIFSCPCHGSQFDRNGAVVQGPANRPLAHFAVEITATGTVIVHTNTTVGANVRVAP